MVMPLVQKKNPQGLRIDPEDCTRFSSSPLPQPRGNDGQFSEQVFWLMVHPTPRPSHLKHERQNRRRKTDNLLPLRFTCNRSPSRPQDSGMTGFVPIDSGGTTRDSHPLP